MKDQGFPWTDVGPGPEPWLKSDFAARVIEQARVIRSRRRRAKITVSAASGFAAMLGIFLWMRGIPPNQQMIGRASPRSTANIDVVTWSDEPGDLLTVLMPGARQAARFDAYYSRTSWDADVSWDPGSYDASRTR